MIDSLGAAIAISEPLMVVAVVNLVVDAVIGIAVIALLAALLRRITVRAEERREAAPVPVHSLLHRLSLYSRRQTARP